MPVLFIYYSTGKIETKYRNWRRMKGLVPKSSTDISDTVSSGLNNCAGFNITLYKDTEPCLPSLLGELSNIALRGSDMSTAGNKTFLAGTVINIINATF